MNSIDSELILAIERLSKVLPSSSFVLTFISEVLRSSLTIAIWFFCKAIVMGVAFQEFSGLGSAPYLIRI